MAPLGAHALSRVLRQRSGDRRGLHRGAAALSALLWSAGFVLLAYFVVVYLLRWSLYARERRLDAFDPSKVFGFFTAIAAGVG